MVDFMRSLDAKTKDNNFISTHQETTYIFVNKRWVLGHGVFSSGDKYWKNGPGSSLSISEIEFWELFKSIEYKLDFEDLIFKENDS